MLYSLKASSSFPPLCAALAGEQGGGHPEVGEGLAGQAAVQQGAGRRGLPAVLRAPHDRQARAEEAEDRGALRRALQEAQHWHGEQDHAAAAQDRRAGAC